MRASFQNEISSCRGAAPHPRPLSHKGERGERRRSDGRLSPTLAPRPSKHYAARHGAVAEFADPDGQKPGLDVVRRHGAVGRRRARETDPPVPGHERIVWNIRRLIDGAKLFEMPVLATEQYPKGLGGTVRGTGLATRSDRRRKPRSVASVAARLRPSSNDRRRPSGWSPGSKRTCASSKRCSICWPMAGACMLRSTRSARGSTSTARPRSPAWTPPVRRSRPPRRRSSNGAKIRAAPQFKQLSAMIKEPPP